jgi:hypothetical protein
MQRLIFDRKSYTPAGFVRSAVFIGKEYLHRRRDASFRADFVEDDERKKQALAYGEVLRSDGILLLPSYFQGEFLRKLQTALHDAVKDSPARGVDDAWRHEDAVSTSPEILAAALDDFLLEIIGHYYGKPFGLGRADATRLMPTPPKRNESYQWHHDTRGRQIHMMVLLNDVTSAGQRMSYLRGSNDVYYDRYRGEGHGSRFEADMTKNGFKKEDIVELIGPAGTVGLFDSNGLHSGNRNDKEQRDCLLFCFVSKERHFKHVSCRRSVLAGLPEAKRKLVEINPRLKQFD